MRYGSYDLVHELGRGGMGVVYKAVHSVLGTPAVVKLLLPEWTQNGEIVQRFVNEARSAAGLDQRNIVDVKDCNQAPTGEWYIVLEYLDGVPLSKWIREPEPPGSGVVRTGRTSVMRRLHAGPDEPALTVRILVQVANALHTAHEAGIVHRDVKPDNVFLLHRDGNDLHVVLLDFGIAKLREGRQEGLTRTGVGIGTPAYMAPEQLANSKAVDRRADVYALGAVLYEMSTGGHLPWGHGTEAVDIYRRQTSEPPPDPRMIDPRISPALAAVAMRAMACHPAERWESARAFALALAEALAGDPLSASGVTILREYAKELCEVGSGDTTLGNRLPSAELWRPPPTAVSIAGLAAASWPAPASGAGVPSSQYPVGGTSWPPPAAPMTTHGASSGQSVATTMPPTRSRRVLYAILAATGVVGGAVAAALALAGGSGRRPAPAPAAAEGGPPAAVAADAAPALTAVAVVSEPSGAAIFVDGEPRGTTPNNLMLPAGATVQIRGELNGYDATTQPHTVGTQAQTVLLSFTALVDAATPADAAVDAPGATPDQQPKSGRPTRGGKQAPKTPPGSKPAPGFDPNSVGGE